MPSQFDFKYFFDRKAVLEAVGRARLSVLQASGKNIRASAQKSLVNAEGPSAPGSPPHSHRTIVVQRKDKKTGLPKRNKQGQVKTRKISYLREYLYYKFDPHTNSVVVGPEKLNAVVSQTALSALEHGGVSRVLESGSRKNKKYRNVNIKARPFMAPAMARELPNFHRMWKDSVR